VGRYVILANLTDEGVAMMQSQDGTEPLDPIAVLKEAIKRRNGTVEHAFWALGAYDVVAIVEVDTPDDVGAVMLAVGQSGALRTTTLTALPSSGAYTEVLVRAAEVSGHLRGGILRGHLRGGAGGGAAGGPV
jgi:uncharacterized protein with GYD domain